MFRLGSKEDGETIDEKAKSRLVRMVLLLSESSILSGGGVGGTGKGTGRSLIRNREIILLYLYSSILLCCMMQGY